MAANLGLDSDTTAAIAGQIGGAYYGEAGIPEAWRKRLAMGQLIGEMAEQLATSSSTTSTIKAQPLY